MENKRVRILIVISLFIICLFCKANIASAEGELPKNIYEDKKIEKLTKIEERQELSENIDQKVGESTEQNIGVHVEQKNDERASVITKGASTEVTLKNTNSLYLIDGDATHCYGVNSRKLMKYDIITGEEEVLYTFDGYPSMTYLNGSVFYVAITTNTSSEILGYDISKKTIVYNNSFDFKISGIGGIVVDSKQRVYLVPYENKYEIRIYKADKTLLDSFELQDAENFCNYLMLEGLSPNEKELQIRIYYGISHEGYMMLDDTGFAQDKMNLRATYRSPNWKYIKGSEYAISNYGELVKFTYGQKNSSGYYSNSYELLYKFGESNYSIYVPVTMNGNYVYFASSGAGILYKFNMNTMKIEKYFEFGKEKTINFLSYSNGKIYMSYKGSEDTYWHIYVINDSDMQKVETKYITTHGTQKYTISQIKNKYQSAKAKFDYAQSQYKTMPSSKNPYAEGSLKDQVKTDALNQLNLYRWLAGLTPVEIDNSYSEKSQKGAVLLAAVGTNNFSHYPSKPSDMSDEFYNAGYAGTSTSNISYGHSNPASTVFGYILDTSNMQQSNIGHRLSLLNPKANKTSFGFYNGFSTCYIGTTSEELGNSEKFYAYPSAGYYPTECINKYAMWSITLSNNYMFDGLGVTLTIDGKTYKVKDSDLFYDDYYNTVYYNLPTEVVNVLSNGASTFSNNKKVTVELTGLADSYGNNCIYKYDTTFIDMVEKPLGVTYYGHIQDIGWESAYSKSDGQTSGVEGRGLKVEAFRIKLKNAVSTAHIKYSTHVQDIGWMNWVQDGAQTGTTGQNKKVEAIKIKLEGLSGYSVEYRAYVNGLGWQNWVSDGIIAGTTGQNRKLEAIQIRLVKTSEKQTVTPGITYRGHVQDIGWMEYVKDGATSGVEGRGLKVEAFNISLTNVDENAHIKYSTHVQDIGWMNWVQDAAQTGTTGQNKKIEAIKIKLEGLPGYSVQYRAYVNGKGWQNWVNDGIIAGTTGQNLKLEAVQIKIIKTSEKVSVIPGVTYRGHVQDIGWQGFVLNGATAGVEGKGLKVEAFNINLTNVDENAHIKYQSHVQDIGWMNWVQDSEQTGTTGQNKKVEAVRIKLEGLPGYSVEYRAYVNGKGWQPWVKDGADAGTTGKNLKLEALQIKIVKN